MLVISGSGCAVSNQNNQQQNSSSRSENLQQPFTLTQQKAPPNDIQSIQLYPEGEPGYPPVLELNSNEQLVLAFDYLGEQSRQFKVEVSHRSQEWERSPISPSTYLEGFSSFYIQQAKASFSERPSYFHVEYRFPNNQFQPAVSGNYLLEIYSYDSNELLFSLPFFVTENVGSIQTQIENLFAQRDDGRPLAQPFSTYRYPNFVEFPQFDLSMSFVQNQFWGRMKEAGYLDTITPGELNGRLDRNNAFIGNYEFKYLDLRTFDVDGQQILEYQPGVTPPQIILRRDVQNLDTNPRFFSTGATLGIPADDRSSDYAEVNFSFDAASSIPESAEMYVVGHFNNWMINGLNKMSYNPDRAMWEGRALIKQGEYAYKYVLVENNKIKEAANLVKNPNAIQSAQITNKIMEPFSILVKSINPEKSVGKQVISKTNATVTRKGVLTNPNHLKVLFILLLL